MYKHNMHKMKKLIVIVLSILSSDTFVSAIECPDSSSYVTDLRACESTIVVGERATLRSSNKQHSVPCVCDITTNADITLSVNYNNVLSQFCGTIIETQDLKFQCVDGVSTLSFTRSNRIIITNNGIPEVTWCMMFSQNAIAPATSFTIECYDTGKTPPELATTSTSPTPSLSTTIPEASTTIPAAYTTIPAASTTIPAASTTIPVASTTTPAAFTTISAASTTVPAAATTITAAFTTIPAPITTIPSAPTTILASTTINAASTTIPAASTTILAASTIIQAASTTLPAASTIIPAATTTIAAASTTIRAASTTIHAASTTIPATTTIPYATTTIPAPSTTISAASTTTPAASTTMTAASTTIPAAFTTIPAVSKTIFATSTTLPAASTTIPAASTTIHSASSTISAASTSISRNSTTRGTITSELTIFVSDNVTTPAYSSSTEKDLSDSTNLHDPTFVYLAVGLCCLFLLVATLISVYCYFKRNRTLTENPSPSPNADPTIDPRRRSYIDAYDPRNKVFEIVTTNELHTHTKDAQLYTTMDESNDNYDTDMEPWRTDTNTEHECTDTDYVFINITCDSRNGQTRTNNNVPHIYTEEGMPYAVVNKPKAPLASHSVSFANMNKEKTNTPLKGILKMKETCFSDGFTFPDTRYSGMVHRFSNDGSSPNVDSEYVQHMMYPYEAIYV